MIPIINHVIPKSFNHGSEICGIRLAAQRNIISCHVMKTFLRKRHKTVNDYENEYGFFSEFLFVSGVAGFVFFVGLYLGNYFLPILLLNNRAGDVHNICAGGAGDYKAAGYFEKVI